MEVLWKELEICDTRGRLKLCRGIWNLMEASTEHVRGRSCNDGSNGSFHFHRQWKLPCTSMEASTNFDGTKPTFTYFHGNFYGSNYYSNDFHGSFYGSKLMSTEFSMGVGGRLRKFPSKLVETSMEVDRTEVCGP